MKKAIYLPIIILLVVSLISCGSAGKSTAPDSPKTVTYSQFDSDTKSGVYSKVYELINHDGILDSVYNWDYPVKFKKEREKAFKQLRAIDDLYKDADQNSIYRILDDMIQVKASSKAFIHTLKHGNYSYYGDLKNEKPNGSGMLFNPYYASDNPYSTSTFPVFIGHFKNGVPSGYGMLLDSMGGILWESEDISFDGEEFYANGYSIFYYHYHLEDRNYPIDASSIERYNCKNEFNRLFLYLSEAENNLVEKYYGDISDFLRKEHLVFRPSVEYEGNMKKSERSGKGNHYLDTFVSDIKNEPLCISLPYGVTCYGPLDYSGEYKSDNATGTGTFYYPNGIIKYTGKLKKGVPHGKGTLYNSDGTVNYKGKFKNGDIS